MCCYFRLINKLILDSCEGEPNQLARKLSLLELLNDQKSSVIGIIDGRRDALIFGKTGSLGFASICNAQYEWSNPLILFSSFDLIRKNRSYEE